MDNLANIENSINNNPDEGIREELLEDEEELDKLEKTGNWKDKLAFLTSVVLSPFIITPFFALIIVLTFSATRAQMFTYLTVGVIFGAILPFAFVYMAVKRGKISDVHVAIREERKSPFLFTMTCLLLCTITMYLLEAPKEIVVCSLVMFLNSIIFFLITLYWKISMHSTVLASILVSLSILVSPYYSLGFLLLPLMIWARIHRHRHNIYQGLVALLLSITGTFLLFKAFGLPY
jgi:hypothetical protein